MTAYKTKAVKKVKQGVKRYEKDNGIGLLRPTLIQW